MKAGLLSTTVSILFSLVISLASASDDLRVLKSAWSNKASKKQKSGSKYVSKKQKKSYSEGGCEDPLAATLQTLQHLADGTDPVSTAMGYADGYRRIHNGVDTGLDFGSDPTEYFVFIFQLGSLSFTFDHQVNIGPNMASVRYVKGVQFTDGSAFDLPASDEYPFNTSYVQHEHALVTVDDDCKVLLWDQYGDNAEQDAVDENIDALVEKVFIVP